MRSFFKGIWRVRAVFFILLAAFFGDLLLAAWAPVERSSLFSKNDYEKIIMENGGSVSFDKIIYGNSVLISSYIEEESTSGYANLGIDYGTLTDLDAMLRKGYLSVQEDIVLMLNYFVLLDTMETNPTYPWHRGLLEPYCYFQRDRISAFAQRALETFISTRSLDGLIRYTDTSRTVYHGVMTDEELDERIAVHRQLYWGQDLSCYQENLDALERIAVFCEEQGIRLRVIFAPWNSYIDMPENPKAAMEAAREICTQRAVEVLDMTDAVPRKYFHDLGHLNYECGARYFTGVIDEWLHS